MAYLLLVSTTQYLVVTGELYQHAEIHEPYQALLLPNTSPLGVRALKALMPWLLLVIARDITVHWTTESGSRMIWLDMTMFLYRYLHAQCPATGFLFARLYVCLPISTFVPTTSVANSFYYSRRMFG